MYRFLRNRFCSRLLGPLVAISAVATLAGCATGPAFQALEPLAPDQAQLYIYRKFDWSMPGQGVHEVTIDGQKEHLRLPHTGWQRVLLTPGTHTVAITGPWGGAQMHASSDACPNGSGANTLHRKQDCFSMEGCQYAVCVVPIAVAAGGAGFD